MATERPVDETAVSDRYAVTIPSSVRERLGIGPGDRVRWRVTEEEELAVEVVREREGAFDDFEPFDIGETNAAADHDTEFVDHSG
jgi:AbrB family looped-hinge helix DNA binding protein